jgi:Uma2 family endonuclease
VATRPKLTYEDYVHFPDNERWELIDGEAYFMPSPTARHQNITLDVAAIVRFHLKEHGGGEVFVAPFDVVLANGDVLQPDVVFIADEDISVLTEANVWGTPSWAVEVLSTDKRRDRVLKFRRHEKFGLNELWLIDPFEDVVEIYRLDRGAYGLPLLARPPDRISPLRPEGLEIDLADLFKPRPH